MSEFHQFQAANLVQEFTDLTGADMAALKIKGWSGALREKIISLSNAQQFIQQALGFGSAIGWAWQARKKGLNKFHSAFLLENAACAARGERIKSIIIAGLAT